MNHNYHEFSFSVRWKRPGEGSFPRVSVPGFYLTTGWVNEGEAGWYAKDHLLDQPTFLGILAAARFSGQPGKPALSVEGDRMWDNARRDQASELNRLREAQATTAARIAALEAQLGDKA